MVGDQNVIIQIQRAKRISKYGNVKRAKVSAVAFTSNGNIIASAHNRRVCGQPGRWTEHAEEVLIHKLNRIKAWCRFDNITILVVRLNARGLVMAKPCEKCSLILKQYPVAVLYTDRTGVVCQFEKCV